MIIKCPTTRKERHDRDRLLQQTLRPDPLPFSIVDEYPILLANKSPYSYCLYNEASSQPIAHANLYDLTFTNQSTQESYEFSLIGNVATAPACQGQGYMTKLLDFLTNKAISNKKLGLVLWTDLAEFYQKRGFQAVGKEVRARIRRIDRLALYSDQVSFHCSIIDPHQVSCEDLDQILKVRYKTDLTVFRKSVDFKKLLTIPYCRMAVARSASNQILAYMIVGKGYDMIAVAHEWGYQNSRALISCIDLLFHESNHNEIMILGPESCAVPLQNVFKDRLVEIEFHEMALMKPLNHAKLEVFEWYKAFIWGLDSI